jgi:hypothetical protein
MRWEHCNISTRGVKLNGELAITAGVLKREAAWPLSEYGVHITFIVRPRIMQEGIWGAAGAWKCRSADVLGLEFGGFCKDCIRSFG